MPCSVCLFPFFAFLMYVRRVLAREATAPSGCVVVVGRARAVGSLLPCRVVGSFYVFLFFFNTRFPPAWKVCARARPLRVVALRVGRVNRGPLGRPENWKKKVKKKRRHGDESCDANWPRVQTLAHTRMTKSIHVPDKGRAFFSLASRFGLRALLFLQAMCALTVRAHTPPPVPSKKTDGKKSDLYK
nr:hypothetical protein [Pandoravirus aubagnensis]